MAWRGVGRGMAGFCGGGPQAEGKPAVLAAPHGMAGVEQEIDAFCGRGPQAERHAVLRRPCAEGWPHSAPAKASTQRGGALLSLPGRKSIVFSLVVVVFRICCQLLYAIILGSLNAISSGAAFRTIKIAACPGSSGPIT